MEQAHRATSGITMNKADSMIRKIALAISLLVIGCGANQTCPEPVVQKSPAPISAPTMEVASGQQPTWPEGMDCRSGAWVQAEDVESEGNFLLLDYNRRNAFIRTDKAFHCCELSQFCFDHIQGNLKEIVNKCLEWQEYACYAHPHDELAYHHYR